MLKYTLMFFLLVYSSVCFGQTMTTEQWNKMRDEAFLNYIENGGTPEGFKRNADKIIDDYIKKTYSYNNSGEIDRKSSLDAKRSSMIGSIYSGVSMIGSCSNGVVRTGVNQIGTYRNGFFYTNANNCIAKISGSVIKDCLGRTLFSVNQNAVFNASGRHLFTINGNQLLTVTGQNVTINGISMESLAAYLLFFYN